jgi:DNA mismatch repair protein MutS2
MISITEKTLQDLQFNCTRKPFRPSVIQTLETKALEITFRDKETLMLLMQTSEYVSSFQNNTIPNHGFDAISHEIKFLAIEDSFF